MSKFDQIDRAILHELERNGRLTNIELARKIGLSTSACLRRVQELERNGTILGYRAVLNRDVLGSGFVVMVAVGLSRHLKADQVEFERVMANAPEVRECHSISGTVEYLLRIEVADLAAYKHFHTEVLGMVPQVSSITSHIVMASPKDERA
ncbi:MAG: Lrp/AsnC family transcriptional regulator [Pseudomonadota bacterium]